MAEGATATDAPAEPLNLAPIAAILVIAGPVLVAVSSFLEWAGRNFKPAGKVLTFGGFEVPAKFVIDSKANLDGSGLPLGVLVLVAAAIARSEEHTSELQSRGQLVCRLLLDKK